MQFLLTFLMQRCTTAFGHSIIFVEIDNYCCMHIYNIVYN